MALLHSPDLHARSPQPPATSTLAGFATFLQRQAAQNRATTAAEDGEGEADLPVLGVRSATLRPFVGFCLCTALAFQI